MIGDWVYFNDSFDKVQEICYIQGSGMCASFAASATLFPMKMELIKPIPLTVEILEKNGFIKCLWDIYKLPLTSVSIEHTGSLFCLRISNMRLFTIKSVSHLQHLLRDLGVDKEIVL